MIMKTTRRGFIKGILGASAVAVVAPTVFNTAKDIDTKYRLTVMDDSSYYFTRLDALREADVHFFKECINQNTSATLIPDSNEPIIQSKNNGLKKAMVAHKSTRSGR